MKKAMSGGIDHQYELETFPTENLPPFQFQKRFGEINWRKLSSINLDQLVRELDFVTLQENISAVTFCNIDTVPDVDPLVAKLLKLAQYTIEYLLHSQDYLQSVIEGLENKISSNLKTQNSLKLNLNEANTEVGKYKAESKRRKKIIQQQQLLIESGASSFYQCPHCEKAFMNASFLQGHMQRRHPDSAAYIGDVIKHAEREQQKLGDHIKLLEQELQKDRQEFEEKLKLANAEKILWEQKAQQEMTDWKEKEEEKWMLQVEQLKATFANDLEQLKSKEVEYKKTIETLEDKLEKSQSNLGVLEDDYRKEKKTIKKYGTRMQSLEDDNIDKDQAIENLYREIRRVKSDSDKRLMNQEKRLGRYKDNYILAKNQPKKVTIKKKKAAPVIKEKPPIIVAESPSFNEPDFRSNYDEMLKQYKPYILQLLDDKLNKCGVDPLARGIAKTMLTNKLVVLKKERQQKSVNDPNFYQIRNSIKQKLEQNVNQRLSSPKRRKKGAASKSRDDYQPPVFSTPLKDKSSNRRKDFESSSPKLSEIKQPSYANKDIKSDLGSLKDEFSSPWDTSEEDDKVSKGVSNNTLVPTKDKVDDWDDESIESYQPIKRSERPKSSVKQLADDLDKKLKNQKPVNVAGGVQLVQPFDASDNDDLFSISSQEEKPKPLPRHKGGGQGTASTAGTGTSVWGSEQKPSTGDLTLSDLSD